MIITLKQSSPSNDVLSGFANVDELTNAGVVPIWSKTLVATRSTSAQQDGLRNILPQNLGKISQIVSGYWTS